MERNNMDLPEIIGSISKQQIVDTFVKTRAGELSEEQFNSKFNEVLQYIYDCGREMGMTEALNYIENSADRERLFNGIDQLREEIDNER